MRREIQVLTEHLHVMIKIIGNTANERGITWILSFLIQIN
jgi:hypothetical protein